MEKPSNTSCSAFVFVSFNLLKFASKMLDFYRRSYVNLIRLHLPGLVSAGFFANAFLIEFDEKVGQLIGGKLSPMSSIIVHDYCRYVDDLRLVISATNVSVGHIRRALNRIINHHHKVKVITLGSELVK